MLYKRILPFIIFLFTLPSLINAQQTTGSITGFVKDANGQNLAGATITAVHVPTNSKYLTVAKNGGQFTLPNLRIGGPYTVTIHFTGFTDQVFNDQNVALGTPLNIEAVLNPSTQVLTAVTISGGGRGLISSQRNGTSTNISARQIQNMPTINRNIQDFARLTPQAKAGTNANTGEGAGLSFAGQSNRYNQFSIDGANASDAFGLGSTGTNGGNSNINPISIEAIQEIQIVLAPYDVTQGGFTGGGINAVTKSGTNKLHGSLYGQYQNQSFVGKSSAYNSTISRLPYGDFKNQTFGASLGGPIIKNKLFFFVSGERYKKSTPIAFDPTVPGSGSKVSVDTLEMIKNFMLKNYGFDLGSYGAINNENQSTSLFGRIDWNISSKHKLTLRHNYVNGSNDFARSRGATAAFFENTGYNIENTSNSSVIELNSTFSSSASNVLRLTYNSIKDARVTPAAPNLFISSYDVVQKANISYTLGSEFSSQANSLDQNILTITDNFTLYKGNHTLTFGTNNEFFKSSNVFLQAYYGAYTYSLGNNSNNNIANWMANISSGITQYQVGYSAVAGRGDKSPAILKSAQLSAYAQDVWSVTKAFKLTYGLRVDLPYIKDAPAENTAFNTAFAAFDVKTNQIPKQRLMFSPRVGFNWNIADEGVQIRGGLGMFTGRIPFVWISNQFSNTGVTTKNLTYTTTSTPTVGSLALKYVLNPNDPQLGAFIPAAGTPAPSVINVIDKNFKFPQVFRANLAADKKLGTAFVATFETVFTKNINNAFYSNLNISPNGESTVTLGPTTRPYWSKPNLNTNYGQVIKLSNTSKGYSFNFTAQLQKTYSKGWQGSIAYTYGTATSLNDIPSSVATSNYRGVTSVNGLNKLVLSASNFDVGSRVTGFISKEFKYLNHLATTFTLFYSGQTGQGLSYVYAAASSKNITGEDNSSTSLVYIPTSLAEANFVDIANGATASQQWANFQALMASNKYLQTHAGQNAERNGDRMPWENHFDLRVSQDFLLKSHKLQIFADVVNVGALLNKDWGRSYGTGSTPDGFFPTTSLLFTPIVSGSQKRDGGTAFTPTVNNPAFQFNINNFTKIGNDYKTYNVNSFTSRWNAQIGVRYSF
ncbi:MAG: TonB-dependent receptor [Chitinophagaceae bacterium]|nr:TonB-dependent receptor [Chitinophagaceae bacterium]